MLPVHGHGHGASGGRQGPAGLDFESVCIKDGYVAFLFIIVKNGALAIGNGIFHTAPHSDDFHYSFLDWIDDSRILAVAIECKDKFGRGIVDYGVGVRGAFDFARDLQGLEIKHNYGSGIPIRDKSFSKLWKHKDAMAALQT